MEFLPWISRGVKTWSLSEAYSAHLMEHKGSSPHSQQPAVLTHPELGQSSPHGPNVRIS